MKKLLALALSLIMITAICVTFIGCDTDPDKYTVTFDSAGGTAVPPQEVISGEVAEKPAAPTKAKHDFAGWYNGETEYQFTTPVTGNITLVAHWSLNDGVAAEIVLAPHYTTRNMNMNETEGKDVYTNNTNKFLYVGTDNIFNLPVVAYNEDLDQVNLLADDYTVTVKVNGTDVTFDSVATKHDGGIRFLPNEIAANSVVSITISLTNGTDKLTIDNVKVTEGYNIYTEQDLADSTYAGKFYTVDPTYLLRQPTIIASKYYLQKPLQIAEAHVPAELFLTAAATDADKALFDRIGGKALRDECVLYGFVVDEGKDLLFNGNFYTIDYSAIPSVIRNGREGTEIRETVVIDGLAQPKTAIGVNACFISLSVANDAEATFENINIVGNTGVSDANNLLKYCGGLKGTASYGKDVQKSTVNYDNVHIAFAIEAILSSTATNNVAHSNLYNCFGNAVYLWFADMNVTKSNIEGTGGPAFNVVNSSPTLQGDDYKASKLVIDDKTVIDAKLTGEETWFNYNLPGFGASMKIIFEKGIAGTPFGGFNALGKTVLDAEGYFNWVVVIMETDLPSKHYVYGEATIAGDSVTMNPTLLAAAGGMILQPAPNPTTGYYGVNTKYVGIGMDATAAGMATYVSVMLEWYNYAPKA